MSSGEERSDLFPELQILAPMLNIYENIVFPLTLDGRKPDEELLRSIISFLRLEDLLDAFPGGIVWWTATTGSNCTGIDRKTPSCSGG